MRTTHPVPTSLFISLFPVTLPSPLTQLPQPPSLYFCFLLISAQGFPGGLEGRDAVLPNSLQLEQASQCLCLQRASRDHTPVE